MSATYEKMDEAVPRLKELLTGFLTTTGTERLCNLLQDTGSLVAGGSVLQAYPREENDRFYSSDIDIYVPIKNAKKFLDTFSRGEESIIRNRAHHAYKSALYCKSFLQKNGIKKVYNFSIYVNRNTIEFDIMIVRNRRTPLQVVNNFDLTFCQIWFDGVHVYASHPEDVKNKKGTLQGEYVGLFLEGNKFLRQRLRKYGNRGYEVVLDKEQSQNDITSYLLGNICMRDEDNKLLPHWTSRVLLSWFANVRNTIYIHKGNLPSNFNHEDVLIVPLINRRNYLGDIDQFGKGEYKPIIDTNDDGYDSEDYEENEKLYDLMFEKYLEKRTPTDLVQIPPETNPSKEIKQLLFHRGANKLLEIAMWPIIYNHDYKTLGKLLEERLVYIEKFNRIESDYDRSLLYYNELKKRCIRKGTSFITQEEDVEIYDLHEHPAEASISADDLEMYLQHHITITDKSRMPCYYKPNPRNHDDPVNCKHFISLSEVKYIVSKEFYDTYNAPPPTKLGLDQFMTHYDQTLHNAKDNTPGWGEMYHHSVCPFCLQFESRDSGCAYMTHENTKGLPDTDTPYCDERLKIEELVARYRAVSDSGEATHLEFCVECGRPCVDHSHISSSPPYTKIEAPIVEEGGRRRHDYAACTGGGRAEMFARILAIRKVYREGGYTDPKEERRQAALAADNAPNDVALMTQGGEILEQEEASRRWTNAPIPETKMYNDPAYRGNREENRESNVNVNEQRGGRTKYRKTRTKNSFRKNRTLRKSKRNV
jgi:hypothetical protein